MRRTRKEITPVTTRSLNRLIFRLMWPAIVANITTPLLSLADMAIVGHIGEADLIAAIALGGMVFNMLYWVFGFLRMGTSGLTAQAFGAGDTDECRNILMRSLLIAVVVGTAMIIAIDLLTDLVMMFMDADAATVSAATTYIRITVLGAPATLSVFALSGWFLGMQSARRVMAVALLSNIINIFLSLVLVFVFEMRIQGVATGTAVSQWLGFVIAAVMAAGSFKAFSGITVRKVLRFRKMTALAGINGFIFARTLCLVAVTLWFTRVGAQQGAVMLAANALIMQLFMLFSYFTDGLAFAGEALSGRFQGEGDMTSLRALVRRLLQWGGALALVTTLLYMVCGDAILSLITDDAAALAAASSYDGYAAVIPLVGFGAFVWDGIYAGRTLTARMFVVMAVSTAVFFALWFAPIPVGINHHLWIAFLAYLLCRSLLMPICHPRIFP